VTVVQCTECGKEQEVGIQACMRGGWPECCGYTMRLVPGTCEPQQFGAATDEILNEAEELIDGSIHS